MTDIRQNRDQLQFETPYHTECRIVGKYPLYFIQNVLEESTILPTLAERVT
jgi:hypothetical protein